MDLMYSMVETTKDPCACRILVETDPEI